MAGIAKKYMKLHEAGSRRSTTALQHKAQW
jgi:hypothetical protein